MNPSTTRAGWATPGRTALLATASVAVGLVGVVLSPWPPLWLALLASSVLLLGLAFVGARISRGRAREGAPRVAALAATAGNGLATLLVLVWALAGSLVAATVTWGPPTPPGMHGHGGTRPMRAQEVVVAAAMVTAAGIRLAAAADAGCEDGAAPAPSRTAASTEPALLDRAAPYFVGALVIGLGAATVYDAIDRGEMPRFAPIL